MSKKLILLGARLLVKPDDVAEKFDSTIDLKKTDVTKVQEKPQTGEVMYISDECKFVQIGDKIHFNPWAGLEVDNPNSELKLAGVKRKRWLIMNEQEVMMITERKEG
jgi:co-chaperonin GroES (HSP10)